ncbi:MAG: restriction endonuclease subunit S [Selenomonadaceae bacterium]|nr:restriction endonuclease subunit S [Selenomonadaceae bacterium]
MAKKFEEIKEEEYPYELPEGWKWERLGKCVNLSANKTELFLDSTKYVGLENIEKDTGIIKYEIGAELKSIKNVFVEGQILLRPYLNKHGIAKFKGVCSTDILVFSANNDVSNKWVDYYFNMPSFISYAISNSTGINLPRVNSKSILSYVIPIPPKETQQKIVDIIESLFAKLDITQEKVEQVLAESENRRSAILHNAFSGKLTEKWRKENNVSFDSWCIDKLKNFDIEIIDGDRGKNYPKKEEFSNKGECVFLNAKNVTKKGFSFSEVQFISKEKDDLLRKGKLVRGDIVLTTRGTIGNIALYDDVIPYNNMRINSGMVIYRCGDTLYKPFLINLYRSKYIIDQINEMQTGSAQPQLPIKIMNELELCLPTLLEQKEIVRLLDKFLSVEDKVKSTCQSTLEAIATMRKSILAKAFRGELCS